MGCRHAHRLTFNWIRTERHARKVFSTGSRADSADRNLRNHRGSLTKEGSRAYTIDAAYLVDAETFIGSIEIGKRADLIVIDTDLFNATPDEIAETKVLVTMMNGRFVHDEGASADYQCDYDDQFENFEYDHKSILTAS